MFDLIRKLRGPALRVATFAGFGGVVGLGIDSATLDATLDATADPRYTFIVAVVTAAIGVVREWRKYKATH